MTKEIDLNQSVFIGIDAHTGEHTALAINRFEEELGRYAFANSREGIGRFLNWVPRVWPEAEVMIGIEGGGTERHALLAALVAVYPRVYEINPLFTKQRRDYGTRGDKSDARDAKLIAEVVAKKFPELPLIHPHQLAADRLALKKTVWFHEEMTGRGAAIQVQLKQLAREKSLAATAGERRLLTAIFKAKQRELVRNQKTRRVFAAKLEELLPESGRNLTTVPGIATILAAKITAHTDGVERFANLNKFIRYAGIAPLERSSGKSKRYIKANRGNRKLHTALYLAALSQRNFDPSGKAYFAKKVAEGKTKRHALRCLTKRVACIAYGIMKSGQPYRRQPSP